MEESSGDEGEGTPLKHLPIIIERHVPPPPPGAPE